MKSDNWGEFLGDGSNFLSGNGEACPWKRDQAYRSDSHIRQAIPTWRSTETIAILTFIERNLGKEELRSAMVIDCHFCEENHGLQRTRCKY